MARRLFCVRLFSLLLLFETAGVKARVKGVEILAVEPVGQQPQVLAEPLIVNDFARTQKADRVLDVVVVGEPENIIVGGAGFLL